MKLLVEKITVIASVLVLTISFLPSCGQTSSTNNNQRVAESEITTMDDYAQARAYYLGEGVDQSFDKAFNLYLKVAEKGHPEAQFMLALMYDQGQGVVQNKEEAFKWVRKAAEQGYLNAEYGLGYMYATEENYGEAFIWFKKAAIRNHPRAQHAIGYLYHNGLGVNKNYNDAVEWYGKAAELGNEESQKEYEGLCMGSPLANCPTIAIPKPWMAPKYVFFDSSNPAYCHMIAIDNLEDFLLMNEGKEDEIRDKTIPGDEFYRDHLKYLENCQIINDYPGYDLKKEVIKILTCPEGQMFSITWNGGIAITVMDHRHAERIYKQYQDDPEEYLKPERSRQAVDPIHPQHWLYVIFRNYEKALADAQQKATKGE